MESGIMEPPERGDRNEYLLDPEQSGILKRLAEVEENHDIVKEAIGKLEEKELSKRSAQELRERVETLEARTDVLEGKVKNLEDRLSVQNDRLQQYRER